MRNPQNYAVAFWRSLTVGAVLWFAWEAARLQFILIALYGPESKHSQSPPAEAEA